MKKEDLKIIRDVLEMLNDCKFHDLPVAKAVEQVTKLQKLAKLLAELDKQVEDDKKPKPKRRKKKEVVKEEPKVEIEKDDE